MPPSYMTNTQIAVFSILRTFRLFLIGILIASTISPLFTGCGKDDEPSKARISVHRQSEVEALVALARSRARTVDGLPSWDDGNPRQPNQGNGNLFGALLCISGEAEACAILPALYCPQNASLRRNPWEATCPSTGWSRDELLGRALYWAATGRHGERMASSFPFLMTPQMWMAVKLGGQKAAGRVPSEFEDSHTLLIEAMENPVGYRLHLTALQLWLRREEDVWNSTYRAAMTKVLERQPRNPFYRWLKEGASTRVVNDFLEFGAAAGTPRQAEWSWQCADSCLVPTKAHLSSLVFLGNLILGKSKL